MYYSIIAILVSGVRLTSATNDETALAAELCNNPLVTSATKTPYGVICLIPRPVSDAGAHDFKKRQYFVRSLPKFLKGEANGMFLLLGLQLCDQKSFHRITLR